ncbi:MAG: heme ABC exporter ATP-binding protein CcmA [Ardenticatenia bacterium]|nr:heme ABC exporter ATP-binding protein CcmA [Ardenticatenia bacterium]
MTLPPLIEVEDLHKNYGLRRALRGIHMRVAQGEWVTLFGPNGAGKTTLIHIIATLVRPSRGTVRLQGHPLTGDWTEARRHIGLVSHRSFLYPDLTAAENLRLYAHLYDVSSPEARIRALAERVGLAKRLHDPVRTFSRGMVQRLTIARALIHDPQILLLDEPYTGLDAGAVAWLTRLLGQMAREGHTILMATHNVEQGLALCDRAIILHRGRLVFESSRQALSPDEWQAVYRAYVEEPA